MSRSYLCLFLLIIVLAGGCTQQPAGKTPAGTSIQSSKVTTYSGPGN